MKIKKNEDDKEDNLPTEEEMITLARMSIFKDVLKRKEERDKVIQEEKRKNGQSESS